MFKRSYGKKKKEKRKKRKELARKRHLRKERGVSKKTASLFVLEEVGRRRIIAKKREKKGKREKTSRPRVNQLHFWLFSLHTLAPLHLQTHSPSPLACFLFLSPSTCLVSFRERDQIKFSIDSFFVSCPFFFFSIFYSLFPSPSIPLSLFLYFSHPDYR